MIEVRNNVVYFSSGCPSNFHPAPIVISVPYVDHEMEFSDNEHYYQAMKAALADLPTHFREIVNAATPGQAKRLGRAVPLSYDQLRTWNHSRALGAMVECNIAKYRQHYDCWLWLKNTRTMALVEHRRDPIWGDNLDGTGRNLLGKTLELVRALVR